MQLLHRQSSFLPHEFSARIQHGQFGTFATSVKYYRVCAKRIIKHLIELKVIFSDETSQSRYGVRYGYICTKYTGFPRRPMQILIAGQYSKTSAYQQHYLNKELFSSYQLIYSIYHESNNRIYYLQNTLPHPTNHLYSMCKNEA
ncbi:hypothetical protein MMC2321_03402 [Chitinophaga sp. MM2321]